MNLLLDTSVLIDYFGQRRPFCDDWDKLEVMRELGDATLRVSSESFTDTFYLLRSVVDPKSLQRAFLESLEFFSVCPVGEAVIREAAERSWIDFEDCVIGVCAENVQADYIITRDEDGFAQSSVPSMSIPSFFEHLEKEHGIVYDIGEW